MKKTIDTSIKPDWFDLEMPEERKYWSAGGGKTLGKVPGHRLSDYFVFFTSERAAFMGREERLRRGAAPFPNMPCEYTREQINVEVLDMGGIGINVRDETGQVVESWSVV